MGLSISNRKLWPRKHTHTQKPFMIFFPFFFAAAKRWRINSRHWIHRFTFFCFSYAFGFVTVTPLMRHARLNELHSYKIICINIKAARESCTHLYLKKIHTYMHMLHKWIVRYGLPIHGSKGERITTTKKQKEKKWPERFILPEATDETHTNTYTYTTQTWYVVHKRNGIASVWPVSLIQS